MFTKAFALIAILAATASAQTSFFTYQGTLEDAGAPADGLYDIRFNLYDDITPGAPDNLLGSFGTIAVQVTDGLFTVDLSFGIDDINTFNNLYLELLVRPNGPTPYTTLTPRQEITSTPRAIRSLFAGQALSIALPFAGSGEPDFLNGSTFQITNSTSGTGIRGNGSISGVLGTSSFPTGGYPGYLQGTGVAGVSSVAGVHGSTDDGFGVVGWASTGTGGHFQTRGNSPIQYALYAESTDGSTAGLFEVRDNSNVGHPALIAKTNSTQFGAKAVYGIIESTSPDSFSTAVRGENRGTSNLGIGVYGSHDGSGWGVYGTSGPGGLAGRFDGDVSVIGTLSKSGGSFKIDHPQDPENMFLSHSFVESPDMKNIYDGVIILNKQGQAIVTLPSYFNALNQEFRYQLTTIGGYAPVYIAAEIESSVNAQQFAIAGGTPGLKVSWQVTGIRHDAWANENRIPIEEFKTANEKGLYLNPGSFGKPKELGIGYIQLKD